MFQIISGSLYKGNTVSDLLFGPRGEECLPYDEIIGEWESQKRWILPLTRWVCYHYGVLGTILYSPIWVVKKIFCCGESQVLTRISLSLFH
jgi:hypothetical protein